MLGMASCRVVVANGVDVDNNVNNQRLNTQSIKCITSGDSMHNITVQCNILACMNTLVANTIPGTYARPENLRHVVVEPTVNERRTIDRTSTPTSQDDVRQLLNASVATRLYYETPPIEIHALMATIFHGLHQDVWTYIQQDCQVSLSKMLCTPTPKYVQDMACPCPTCLLRSDIWEVSTYSCTMDVGSFAILW